MKRRLNKIPIDQTVARAHTCSSKNDLGLSFLLLLLLLVCVCVCVMCVYYYDYHLLYFSSLLAKRFRRMGCNGNEHLSLARGARSEEE